MTELLSFLNLRERAEIDRLLSAPSETKELLESHHQKSRPSRAQIASWKDNPVLFAQEALGLGLWEAQARILDACRPHMCKVAVKSGHKIGKSCDAAIIALWWAVTRKTAFVIMTSACSRSVRLILWLELRRRYLRARYNFGGELAMLPETGLVWPDGRAIYGFATKEPDRMAGISGAELLYICDEASGIPNTIFEAIEGNMAGGASMIMFSNPLRPSGYFYEAFATKCSFWKSITVSSEETPNASGIGERIPGLAERKWIDETIAKWGAESAYVAVRIKGEFPSSGTSQVCGLRLVDDAMARHTPEEGPLVGGLDVAEFGDDESVLTFRRGLHVYPQISFAKLDGPDLAGEVLREVRARRRPSEVPTIFIDSIGVGAGPMAVLSRSSEVHAVGVRVGDGAIAGTEYANRRAEVYFNMASALRSASIPPSADLKEELIAPTYGFDAKGRLLVEKKDEIKKKIGRSPDHSESLMLSMLEPRATPSRHAIIGHGSGRR